MNYLVHFYLLNILNRNIYIFFLAIETIPQKSSGISTGSIIGIIFGVLGFVTIALILCLVCLRFQRRKMLFYKHQYFLKTGKYSVSYVIVVLCFSRKINQIYFIKQWFIDFSTSNRIDNLTCVIIHDKLTCNLTCVCTIIMKRIRVYCSVFVGQQDYIFYIINRTIFCIYYTNKQQKQINVTSNLKCIFYFTFKMFLM